MSVFGSKNRRYATIGGTFACALGIGFIMQQGEMPKAAYMAPPASELAAVPGTAGVEVEPLGQSKPLEQIAVTKSADWPEDVPSLPSAEALAEGPGSDYAPLTPHDPEVPRLGCPVEAMALSEPGAQVSLSVRAPCLKNERLTVHHNGMMFSASTDETGRYDVIVPALAERAVFIVGFGSGTGATASVHVPDLKDFDRVVLQWSGAAGFQIHAREFGATYGGPGHVWTGAETEQLQSSGSMVRLGDATTFAPRIAEVYSFPTAASETSGIVALSVETEVTADNCGNDVTAQTLTVEDDGMVISRDVAMAMPDCSAIGEFLVLNNLMDDLKIAAN